jgi:hypothetical protein
MIQASGIMLILLGAIMFHIAAGSSGLSSIGEIWKDMLAVMEGKALK